MGLHKKNVKQGGKTWSQRGRLLILLPAAAMNKIPFTATNTNHGYYKYY